MAKLTNQTIEKLVRENKVIFEADPVPREKYKEIRKKIRYFNKQNHEAGYELRKRILTYS
jgi:hypothetical protein